MIEYWERATLSGVVVLALDCTWFSRGFFPVVSVSVRVGAATILLHSPASSPQLTRANPIECKGTVSQIEHRGPVCCLERGAVCEKGARTTAISLGLAQV